MAEKKYLKGWKPEEGVEYVKGKKIPLKKTAKNSKSMLGNKNAVGNKGGHPPIKWRDEFVELVYNYALLGAKEVEIAEFFGVTIQTIGQWKKDSEGFKDAILRGKAIADGKVAQSLYKRALGYEHDEVDIKMYEGQIIKTPIIKKYPPDTTAAIFWLKNRRPKDWRDKQDNSHEITVVRQVFKIGDQEIEFE